MAVRYIDHTETHRDTETTAEHNRHPVHREEKSNSFVPRETRQGSKKKKDTREQTQDALSSLTSTSIAQVAQALHKHRAEKRT